MKRMSSMMAALLSVAMVTTVAGAQQPDTRPGIAVFPITNGGSFGPDREDLAALEVGLQHMLLTELAQNSSLRIVERSVLRELMEEQNLGASGRVDAGTAARLGRIVGARYVVLGVFMDNFGDFRMDTRIVDVETTEVLRTQEVRGRREGIYDLLFDMATRITSGARLPPLPSQISNERRTREIPAEAVTLYSRAQVFQDAGRTDRAIELYRMIAQQFPAMTEATEALRQLTES
jgi:TolB-like protein